MKSFCVINGPPEFPKPEIEKKVVELGGTVVQNPGPTTFCVLAEKIAIRVTNLIKRNIYDIVKVDWFQKCVDAQRWLPWSPADMIHTSPKTQKAFHLEYDDYGDSYSEDTTVDQLKTVFDGMEEDGIEDATEIAELEQKYFPDDSPYGLFRTCRFYMDNNMVIGDLSTHIKDCSLDLLSLQIRFFGGTISDDLDSGVSHVIVDKSDLNRLQTLKDERRKRKKKFHLVTEDWIRECIEEGTLTSERSHEPV